MPAQPKQRSKIRDTRESLRGPKAILLIRALEVFGDSDRAMQWMREENPALRNEQPIHVMQTDKGREEVMNILGRIEHGILS
jgi:putative toxin-antitoxin system antitoxin component (TIGR02293 family)